MGVWHLYFLMFLSFFVNTSNKKNLLPRTNDPSCLFEPKIALFGFDGGLPMLSIRYCAINILSSGNVQNILYILYYQVLCVQYLVIYWTKSVKGLEYCRIYFYKKFRKGLFTSFGCFSMNFCVPWVWRTKELWCVCFRNWHAVTLIELLNLILDDRQPVHMESILQNPSLPQLSPLSTKRVPSTHIG